MGLANLVPGISGGTMLVAAGVYRRFIDAIADVSRFRLKGDSIAVLAVIVCSAVVAIGALSTPVAYGLTHARWAMYSLFIGLTLGGVPVLWKLVKPMTPAAWVGLIAGVLAMLGLVALQASGAGGGHGGGTITLALAGAAGASAMILPGVSGAYLLLLLGEYDRIVTAIKDTVKAGVAGDVSTVADQLAILVPVGVGVVIGVVVVSIVLRWLMHRYEKATLGVLLGLLVAAPAGLYPFRAGVQPTAGDTFEGEVLTAEDAAEIAPKDWPERFFTPSAGHIAGSLGLIGLGVVATLGVARLGRDRHAEADETSASPASEG